MPKLHFTYFRFKVYLDLDEECTKKPIFFLKNPYCFCLTTFSSHPKTILTELIPCFMCIIQTYTYQFLKISLQKFLESTFPFPRFFAQLFLLKVFILPVILTPASKVFSKSGLSRILLSFHNQMNVYCKDSLFFEMLGIKTKKT